jgi:hypothetical protein
MAQEEGQAQEQPDSEESNLAALAGILGKDDEEEEGAEGEKKPEGEEAEAKGEEGTEAEPEKKADESTIDLDPDAPIFELTVKEEGGKDIAKKVSLKDLQAGYMMQADYQRKTQEIAKQRQDVERTVKEKTEPVIQNYERQLQTLSQVVAQIAAPELQNVNWVQLAQTDPAKYVALQSRAQQVSNITQAIAAEQQKLGTQKTQEMQQARERAANEAVETLKTKIPGWNNDKYRSILEGSIEKYGFKSEEVTQVTDSRIIEVLNDALEYQRLKSAKPIVDKKVVSIPKVVRPGSPDKDGQIADRKKAAITKLRKSGDVEHAAEALFNMID